MNQSTKWSQFSVLISVFFFWGFVAASNDILIPVFKEKLHLEVWQSQMISFCFYVAYTVGSIIYFALSKASGGDILNKIGYKNGIGIGLVISAIGTLLFYPAANTASFPLMLAGLFIVGLGFSLQQTAANPLAIIMGDPKSGAQRLSLAGGVNNVGGTIGPLLVSFAIFGTINAGSVAKEASISSVKTPYLILGVCFIIVALIFKFSSLPNVIKPTEEDSTNSAVVSRKSVFDYPQLILGMIGIFVYVGVEVTTASHLPIYMQQKVQHADGTLFKTEEIAPFVSLYWASLMIGRWAASVGAFGVKGFAKKVLNILMPYIAFGVFLLVNVIAKHDITPFKIYPVIIVVLILADILSKGNPAKQLLLYSFLGIVALIIGMTTTGMISVYAFTSVGLFCSTLWPCIFTLAIAGLGKHTNEGSSFLIMMIMGGGVISLAQGLLADDKALGIQYSFIMGVACFAYLAFYAWKAKSILKTQGIDFDAAVSSSH
jgi:FHS family L-fucose permease-like MFS transporter